MTDPQLQEKLAARIEERRKLLEGRADVSQRLKNLSSSSARNPVAPARKTRSPLLALLVTAVAGVALVACVAASVPIISSRLWVQSQLGSPTTTVEDFFSAVHAQNYPQAYSFLSSGARNELSEAQFQQIYEASDTLSGPVDYYAITTTATHGSTATVGVDVVRKADTTTADVFELTLTQENGAWRIVTIRQSGSGPAPTPAG